MRTTKHVRWWTGLGVAAALGLPAVAGAQPIERPTREWVPATEQAGSAEFDDTMRWLVYDAGDYGGRRIRLLDTESGQTRTLVEGDFDAVEPVFSRTASHVVYASNEAGTYDIWKVDLADGSRTRLTELPGDEREPAVSPWEFTLNAMYYDSCSGGAQAEEVDRFERIAFTAWEDDVPSVQLVSSHAQYVVRISGDAPAESPYWSGDGERLGWLQDAGSESVHVVESDLNWGAPPGRSALEGDGCWSEEHDLVYPSDDPCIVGLPRFFVRSPIVSRWPWSVRYPSYSLNQTQVLAIDPSTNQVVVLPRDGRPGRPIQPATTASRARWMPNGWSILVTRDGALSEHPVQEYLADVNNLDDFGELSGENESERLTRLGFVARPSTDQEFYAVYDRLAYARRPVFVTVDTALQAFHDEFETNLAQQERAWQSRMLEMMRALEEHEVQRLDQLQLRQFGAFLGAEPVDPAVHLYFATHFAVARVLLEGMGDVIPEPDEGDDWDGVWSNEPPPVDETALDEATRALSRTVDERIRPEVERHIEAILAHREPAAVVVPGVPQPLVLDYTQFAVRGRYATESLHGYFRAVMWMSLLPLPRHERALEIVEEMGSIPLPGLPIGYMTPRRGEPAPPPQTVLAAFQDHDRFVAGFLGAEVTVTPSLVAAWIAVNPGWRDIAFDVVSAAIDREVAPSFIRGATEAYLADAGYAGTQWGLLSQRATADARVWSDLTVQEFDGRTPRALEVLAAFAGGAVRDLALSLAEAEQEPSLSLLRQVLQRPPYDAPLDDGYHAWLSWIVAYAAAGPVEGMPYTQSDAWMRRRLMSALAAYTVLKHDSILYAMQAYSNQCDGPYVWQTFIEIPIVPRPIGAVEPEPELWTQLASLVDNVTTVLRAAQTTSGRIGYRSRTSPVSVFCQTAARIAEAQLANEPLSDEDARWMEEVGAKLELMLLAPEGDEVRGGLGDSGRAENGVMLATDLITHTDDVVLQGAIGRLLHLYVAVPDGPARRMTQGAMYSYYEFTQPMSDRLTDDSWAEMVRSGANPPLPEWALEFVEMP